LFVKNFVIQKLTVTVSTTAACCTMSNQD